ncbi:MAG: DNA-directed RNA polymerase subunit beta [Bacilli bacterium]|nr:DNA-directed RNA polymerase subunit beta [Bacilli bacterium]
MSLEKDFVPMTDYLDPKGKPYPVGINGRLDFSKISGHLDLPYLVEIQTESYKWFLEKGLDEVLRKSFPIANYSNTLFIDYVSCRLEEPKHDPMQCKAADLNYSSKLKVTLRLRFKNSGEIKEAEVFMGDLPRMTESGTFIINGAERVIVSQIVRSPGAYFKESVDKSGVHVFEGEIFPNRGTWLEFETDAKNALYCRVDRQPRKMPATVLLKALGLDDQKTLFSLFGETEAMKNTLEKDNVENGEQALIEIFKKLKPGEPITAEGLVNFIVQKFFDEKRYDLGRAGRFKLLQKLGIYNRLPGRVLAEPLISAEGEIRFPKGHTLTDEDVQALRDEEFFEAGAHRHTLKINRKIDEHGDVNIVKVFAHDKTSEPVVNIIGSDLNCMIDRITISDMVAGFSYFLNVMDGIGKTDDIDHLGNRRVRCVGELLQEQFRLGLTKMSKTVQQKMSISDMESVTPQSLINIRPLTSSIREFFAVSKLSQYMDQVNPLAELTHKRRISALGPGGLTRDRASMEVRDVHYTHYGRICPIESPEGQNIGLINNLCTYAKISRYGFIMTPYRLVYHIGGKAYVSQTKTEYLSADDERGHFIAEANLDLSEPFKLITIDPDADPEEYVSEIVDQESVVRHDDDNILVSRDIVDYVDVSPKQVISIAAACIPFLAHDDATRALMGANMQRQALPLLRPSVPYVGTGMERLVARDSGLAVIAAEDGVVLSVDSATIVVKEAKGNHTYQLLKFDRSNQGSCINQTPIVHAGDKITAGQIIADGPAMRNGELALGQNVLIAYMTWNGYNYEDAVVMSERMVKDDVFTSIHIERHTCECRETKLGPEEITRDIPNVSEEAKAFLDENGIIVPGAEVKEGDILVGKVTPKGQTEPTPEEKLLMAIFAEKTKEGKDASLRVPHGGGGIVHAVKIFSRKNKDQLPPGVNIAIHVYIVQKRKISEGDKMSGRHGNKGVISKILPVEDMPFLADGTPIDILLSPMGVPSRMNIGQIFEVHLGLACRKLGMRVATPAFDGVSNQEVFDIMKKAGISADGKTVLYDGRTGERFAERIAVGVQYMIKLVHMVDDKLHARATGPYALITQQPLGGKAQNGGQRFGEMEVWALEAYGAAHALQEMLTIKSDDRVGRRKAYEAIIKGNPIPRPGMPEAFKVFIKELKGLGLNAKLYDTDDNVIDMDELARNSLIEERKTNSAIRSVMSPKDDEAPDVLPVEEVAVEEEGLSVRATGSLSGDAD